MIQGFRAAKRKILQSYTAPQGKLKEKGPSPNNDTIDGLFGGGFFFNSAAKPTSFDVNKSSSDHLHLLGCCLVPESLI